MVSLEYLPLFLLILGLLPFHISRRVVGGESPQIRWRVHATFWRLSVNCLSTGHKTWSFNALLVQQLISAIWAAMNEMVKK